MKISKDTSVTINYKLFDAEGQEVESTYGDEPITYTHGYEEILVGLEKALEGQEAGAKLSVKLESDDAYGPHNPEGIFAVPLSELPAENDYKKGDWISVHVEEDDDEEGHEHGENCDHEHGDMEVMIHEIRGDEVILDANHPLAGQPISFEVEVLKVEAE